MRVQRFVPVLAAACIGAALLVPGVAAAAQPTVTFHGDCGLLGVGASSRPDKSAVAVNSGGTVTFVNNLDQSAHLMINGTDRGVVPADNQVAVLFRGGRVSVTMLPGCLLGGGGNVGSVTVNVASDPGSGFAGTPGKSPAPGRSPEAKVTASASPAPSGAAASLNPALPAPGDGISASGDPLAAGAGAAPGMDPVAVGTAVPGPPGRHRPAGLLVFVAAICVVGVSVAATRAIIAQRAIRAIAT